MNSARNVLPTFKIRSGTAIPLINSNIYIFRGIICHYFEVNMQTTTESINDVKNSGRWIVVMSKTFSVNEDSRTITLDRFDLADSLGSLIVWADRPRKHGKFYLYDLTKKQAEICDRFLDDRFVLVKGG